MIYMDYIRLGRDICNTGYVVIILFLWKKMGKEDGYVPNVGENLCREPDAA